MGATLEVSTSNNDGFTSKHIQYQEPTLPLAAPVMEAKTAPYPPGVGFRVIPYNITKEVTTILRLTLRRVTPTKLTAGPLCLSRTDRYT
jgi:hypothetical protein